MASSLSLWTILEGALVRELVLYLGEDDIYRLWVFAEEHRLEWIRDYITSDFDAFIVSPTRARHFGMGYACWGAVCRLTDKPANPGLTHETVDVIFHELHQHVAPLRVHADRERAMTTAAAIRSVPEFVMYFAARQGTLESVIWLHTVARYDPAEALRAAAYHGHDHVIMWLLDNLQTAQLLETSDCVECVFRYEDDPALGVLAWRVTYWNRSYVSVYSKKWGAACSSRRSSVMGHTAIDLLVTNGDLESVQRMLTYEVFNVRDYPKLLRNAAAAGHLHVVQWLYDYYRGRSGGGGSIFVEGACPGSTDPPTGLIYWLFGMYHEAVRNGHIRIVRWLFDTFPDGMQHRYIVNCYDYEFRSACERGHLEVSKWLVEERGVPVTQNVLSSAANGGHKHTFEWLHERLPRTADSALQWDTQWLDQAAKSGDLQFVQWLVEDRGLWSLSALASARSLKVAKYLHSYALLHDKPHDLCALDYTATLDDNAVEVLVWQLRHGLRFRDFEKRIHLIAANECLFAETQQDLGWDASALPTTSESTPATIARLRELVRVFIDVYDPETVWKVSWLPKWAAQHGTLASLRRLKAIEHPQLPFSRTFGRLLHTSKSAAKVQWFLTTYPWVFSRRVVRWAVRHDQRRFLVWLCREHLPPQNNVSTIADTTEVTSRCVRHAVRLAQMYDRVEIAAWAISQQ